MKNKVLMWSLIIAGVGLTGFVTYSLLKKPEVKNKPLFSASTIKSIGEAISGIFKKKEVSPYTGYPVDAGINYYDTGIGENYYDPNYLFTPVEEG